MSLSLALRNGDLYIGPGRRFETVSGRAKLLQDLKLHILERIGIDPSTPTIGSRLDGGTVNGSYIESFIGRIMDEEALNEIRSEVIGILQRYQNLQYEKVRSETLRYQGKNTLTAEEIIETIDKVEVTGIGNIAIVQIRLTTLSGSPIKITIPVGQETL